MTKGKMEYNKGTMNDLGHIEFISELKSSFPFSIPDGYFDELPNKINRKISPEVHPSLITIFISRISKPIVAIPSGLAMIIIMVATIMLINQKSETLQYDQGLSLNEILEELPYFYENVEEDEIISLLLVENSESSFGRSLNPDNIESLSDDELIEYLLEEDVNDDLIINF
jgi:hypothetical protein